MFQSKKTLDSEKLLNYLKIMEAREKDLKNSLVESIKLH
jgi:hypothetical protein